MREKKPLEAVVEKYTRFLITVQKYGDGEPHTSLSAMISDYSLNKTVRRALIELAIINLQSDNKWLWLSFDADRKLSLTVLNYLNERSKKQRTTPIAGMEDLVTAIKHNTEALARFSGLNSLKTSDTVKEVELFTIDSQRLQVYCSALGGMLTGKLAGDLDGQSVLMITDTCKYIADNSISLLLNKA